MEKNFLMSKTVWGLILAMVSAILPKFGIQTIPEDAAADIINQLLAVIGAVLILVGRIKAQSKLTIK